MAQALTPTEIVGRRIKKLRSRRGLSAQRLADLCADAGAPDLNRQVITNLENGRRGIADVGEVLILARVLNAPPVLLFTPVGTDDALQLTPTLTLQPDVALRWTSGEVPLPDADTREWRELAAPIALLRDFHARAADFARLDRQQRPDLAMSAMSRVAEGADRLVDAGMPVPPLPATWVERMREHDMLRYPDEVPIEEEEPSDGRR
jgi:transcriptional regulator with XRE-family HTH domain